MSLDSGWEGTMDFEWETHEILTLWSPTLCSTDEAKTLKALEGSRAPSNLSKAQ